MSLSLADLPTELLDQAVPLIDFEGKVRLSSTYYGAYWCRWSLRMPNYRSTTSRTAAGRRIPKALREIIKSLGASSQRVLWSAGAAQSLTRPSKQG